MTLREQEIAEGHDPGGGSRPVGLVLAATVVAAVALVAMHPSGAGHDTASVLQALAQDRVMDAVVHGGMIAAMGVAALCLAAFTSRMNMHRGIVVAGFAAYIIGFVGLAGALMTDGLILPAMAQRFVPVDPATLPVARGLLIFAGAAIGAMLTIGTAFQAIAVVAWAAAFLRSKVTRTAGYAGLAIGAGAFSLAMLSEAEVLADPHVIYAILGLLLLWNALVAILLIRRTV